MKKIILFFAVIILFITIYYAPLLHYGIRQATGQLKIIWNAKPVSYYMQNPASPDTLKQKLGFIALVRKYAVDSLGLKDSKNYTDLYDQKGKPVLWVVTGCGPYEFKPKEWNFPIVGSMPYKGYFKEKLAVKEMQRLKDEGYDAGIRTVGGWSTLGWFKDPILSEMLNRPYGDLANLIIHELVHSTLFVKDSVEFNENLASFIADLGTKQFMDQHYGKSHHLTQQYVAGLEDEESFALHILRGKDKLSVLYDSLRSMPEEKKSKIKKEYIQKIMAGLDTIQFNNPDYTLGLRGYLPNNTYFMSYARYRSYQDELDAIYNEKFHKNLKQFILYMKRKYPFL